MGLPKRPPLVDREALKRSLSKIEESKNISDELPHFEDQIPEVKPKKRPVKKRTVVEPEPELESEADDGWTTDLKTGKRYKKFAAASKEALATNKKNKGAGLTLDQARKMIEVDEDFNLDNLNSSAEMFLAHLRVPPDKDEQKRLIEDRKKRRRSQDSAYQKAQDYIDEVEERKRESRKK